ncbi:GNAT family N-acetyltransferase [Acinetobacter lanii]|uniref:GNAT family N-acetyltransferase n=1 Tax=Acinetobacter lanii TaxID=2715163 RepID=A0A6G8S4G9_9GAMM|nr:GNAT family N-acetyltransferase [Acinetobacter lanii]QIO09099.1 GNAT family N-acetyltransferase [Acinetobacter lanii]
MDIEIQPVTELPKEIAELEKQAVSEGFSFVGRMIEEFNNGTNKFDQQGEFLLMAYDGKKLIACGGLNQQRSEDTHGKHIGRVRRFYVLPQYRKYGVGKQLLQHLEKKAVSHFSALCLNTDTQSAAHFYQKMNYVHVANHPSYNYFKYLINSLGSVE